MLLILFSLCQSLSTHAKPEKKAESKEEVKVFTIKSAVLPSFQLEVINQELPWMEEILFRRERNERPVIDFSTTVKSFYVDLFPVIAPTNAP